MVVMAEYMLQDRLSELRHNINQLHYSYLETEDSPQKLEQRNKLEGYIKEYLCLVPHQQKFSFRETADVLYRSASSKTDFSGYRAAVAWNAISLYAGNLLAQPWRKEYRTIKPYSGFYKHEIEANLVGAEIMFEVMGYKHIGDMVMYLEGPICPDRVANVSRDSLVAFVECQIIKSIWEELSSRFNITWLEVLEFREKHICTPDHAVRALTYRWHERTYTTTHQPMIQTQSANTIPPQAVYTNPVGVAPHLIDTYGRYPPVIIQNTQPPPPQLPMYGSNAYYGYGTYSAVPTNYQRYPNYQYPPPQVPQKIYPNSTNGYCCPPQNGTYVSVQQARTVPTGQLIELDSAATYQDILKHRPFESIPTLPSPKAVREEGTGTYESWDYVFRNLESQGYNKDMGQRGDIINDSKKRDSTKTRSCKKALVDTMHKLRINDDYDEYENRVAHSSSYDNLSSSSSNQKHRNNYTAKTKSLPRESKSFEESIPPQPHSSTTLDPKKMQKKPKPVKEYHIPVSKDDVDSRPKGKNVSGKWHCNACTFLNVPMKDICEMCGKSRSISSVTEMSPMAVGGSECPKCTLINEKNVKICDACGASLTNSPTYI